MSNDKDYKIPKDVATMMAHIDNEDNPKPTNTIPKDGNSTPQKKKSWGERRADKKEAKDNAKIAKIVEKQEKQEVKRQARVERVQKMKNIPHALFNLETRARRLTAAFMLATTVGIGGSAGMFTYQEYTKKNITFTVQSLEILKSETCKINTSILDEGRVRSDGFTGKTVTVTPKEEEKSRFCNIDKTYIVHTDKGSFENGAVWLRGKSEADVERLQRSFIPGETYNGNIYGADIPVQKMLITAQKVKFNETSGKKKDLNNVILPEKDPADLVDGTKDTISFPETKAVEKVKEKAPKETVSGSSANQNDPAIEKPEKKKWKKVIRQKDGTTILR